MDEVLIRSELPGDMEAVHGLLASSFPTDAEARLVDRLRAAGHLTISLVAVAGDEVVGHVGFSPVVTAVGVSGLGLAPVATAQPFRGRGVAARLIRVGLDACVAAGVGWVVVLGNSAYYGRFGFGPAEEYGLTDEYGGGSAFQALELVEGSLPRGAGLVRYGAEFTQL